MIVLSGVVMIVLSGVVIIVLSGVVVIVYVVWSMCLSVEQRAKTGLWTDKTD